MIYLIKYTYLMDLSKIKQELDSAWERYQQILKNPDWNNLNEARAILYFYGQIYCEKIAPEAIDRRLHLLKKPIDLLDFFSFVDGKSSKLSKLRNDKLFSTLEKYYKMIKRFKNRFAGGKYYLDEERFIKLYNKFNPNNDLKIYYKGKFKHK